ncbi:MAG: stage 0 sporulation protein [Spirochaetes bacterium]|nr:stage 0 sporulation protein [Spirochaetota bacterium]HOE20458.1 regulatory iron-sulfur-containing complex subunit RicT [Spirochaetota bacterium]HQL42644.1 regulatory iron-sulfur-containing complex subunit RicT [Spirochaetota bacterium]
MDITGVKLRCSQQIYHVYTNNLFARRNSLCVVETEHGIDIGRVFKKILCQPDESLKVTGKLLRLATAEDLATLPQIEALEDRAFQICKEKIKEKKLEMKLIMVKSLFDKTKIIFYFVADGRIDFRELVRDLAAVFKTRIEMRQIGVRDEARMCGGYGTCGRQLCCVNLKEEFEPVSIKMAKDQNMNLHSLKISGMCGRLLCCLGYEFHIYREINESLPGPGTQFVIENIQFTVDAIDSLKESLILKHDLHTVAVHRDEIINNNGTFILSSNAIEKIKHSLEVVTEDN